jgi:lipopolysaccharide/colanic/teichoic acid biosynthesis glycosyltransferase
MKRAFDLIGSLIALSIFALPLILTAVTVRISSPGPILFWSDRVGRNNRLFQMPKFRSMRIETPAVATHLLQDPDQWLTPIGSFLRRSSLDELPQLVDVWLGHMSLVGPRPEVPRYVACYPGEVRDLVLSVRPGITDRASIEFKDENEILARSADPNKAYIEEVLPIKLAFYQEYVKNRSFLGDFGLIFKTIFTLIR